MRKITQTSRSHLLKGLSSLVLFCLLSAGVFSQATPDYEEANLPGKDLQKEESGADRSTTLTRITTGDALIHGLTIGRGNNVNILNTALGNQALFSNTTGWSNTAVGYQAMLANTTGFRNSASGCEALRYNETGSFNAAFGWGALSNNTSGQANTAIGNQALEENSTGKFNTALGSMALESNTIGNNNVAIGRGALVKNLSGYSNVAIGGMVLFWNNRNNVVAVGDSALYWNSYGATESFHSLSNTAIGSKALFANTVGYHNTASGTQSLYSNTTGYYNTAFGSEALYSNETGYFNTATGVGALANNTTGWSNTANGRSALWSNTTGERNTASGLFSMYDNTTGSFNTSHGYEAGSFRDNITNGTFIGSYAYADGNDHTNITGLGYNARPNASNQVRIGNIGVSQIGGFVGWSNLSDAKYKSNIKENVAGLDFILRLRPVTYNIDAHKLAADLGEDMCRNEDGNMKLAEPSEADQKSRDEKSAIIYSGFIAQEVENAAMELGYVFSGVEPPVHENDFYSLRYAEFVVPIVKAIQEQQQQIEVLGPEGIAALLDKIDVLQADKESMIEDQNDLKEVNASLIAEQEALWAENDRMNRQINDLMHLLSTLSLEVQQCCDNHLRDEDIQPDHHQLHLEGHARLEQNSPNPFHENTLICYYLPEGISKASIIITDLSGSRIMTFKLSGIGHGQILINGGTMAAGTYIYTLTVDELQVESKRMVLL